MKKITPFLWFDGQAEEAMNFYTSIFKNSRILSVQRCGDAGPGPKGSVLTGTFELEGQQFMALPQRRPSLQTHARLFALRKLRNPSGSRRALGQAHFRRRPAPPLRLAHRQIRRLLADHPADSRRAPLRPRPRQIAARDAGHDANG
jgi:hypothetical protein